MYHDERRKEPFLFWSKASGTKKRFNLTLYLVHLIHKIGCKNFFWSHFIVIHSNSRDRRHWWPREIKMCRPLSVRLSLEFASWVGPRFEVLWIHFLFQPGPICDSLSVFRWHRIVSEVESVHKEFKYLVHCCIMFLHVIIMTYASLLLLRGIWISFLISLFVPNKNAILFIRS